MTDYTVSRFWVYFASEPLLWLALTLGVFLFSVRLNHWAKGSPLVPPVLVSMVIIISVLLLSDTDYDTYFDGAQFIHFLLGPATVAIAVPMYDQIKRIRKLWLPIIVACATGASMAVISAMGIALLLGGSEALVLALAPKSVTSPIALGIADQIGAFPSLTAGLVLLTGVIGCQLSPLVFRLLRLTDPSAQGFTLGLAAHGFGTAYAFQLGSVTGAFAGLAMGLTGIFSSFMVPGLLSLF